MGGHFGFRLRQRFFAPSADIALKHDGLVAAALTEDRDWQVVLFAHDDFSITQSRLVSNQLFHVGRGGHFGVRES